MIRRLTASLLVVAATQLAAAPASQAPVDHTIELEMGDAASVDGAPVAGVNVGHFAGTDEAYPCTGDPVGTCRTILVSVTNPFGDDVAKGRERAGLSLSLAGDGVGDAALLVYESDADGARGAEVTSSDQLGTLASEATEVIVTTTEDEQTRYYLVDVFFHAWVGTWTLDASFG